MSVALVLAPQPLGTSALVGLAIPLVEARVGGLGVGAAHEDALAGGDEDGGGAVEPALPHGLLGRDGELVRVGVEDLLGALLPRGEPRGLGRLDDRQPVLRQRLHRLPVHGGLGEPLELLERPRVEEEEGRPRRPVREDPR